MNNSLCCPIRFSNGFQFFVFPFLIYFVRRHGFKLLNYFTESYSANLIDRPMMLFSRCLIPERIIFSQILAKTQSPRRSPDSGPLGIPNFVWIGAMI